MSYLSALSYKYEQNEQNPTLFVFDTNYFLYAYQSYSNGDSYIAALENKKDDMYVPFITYIEFLNIVNMQTSALKSDIKTFKNYVNSVVENITVFDKDAVEKKIKSSSFKLNIKDYDNLNELLKKDVENMITEYVNESIQAVAVHFKEIDTVLNQKLKDFSNKNKEIPEVSKYEEKVKNLTYKLDELLKHDHVVGKKYSQQEINDYIADMDDRYKRKIPPGFCDADKDDKEKVFGDLAIPSKAGDLILWKDLINLLLTDSERYGHYQNVVIVTDDGLSSAKSDWRVRLGNERVVHDQLKIEFFQKTGKLLDLMKVEDFIDYFSTEDEEKKEHLAEEIKSFKNHSTASSNGDIIFKFLGQHYQVKSQKEMFIIIFTNLINLHNLNYKQLKHFSCLSDGSDLSTSIFDSNTELETHGDTIILGTRVSKGDKLKYISELFQMVDLTPSNLSFENDIYQDIWDEIHPHVKRSSILSEVAATSETI